MTPAQLTTLKAFILSQQDLAPLTSGTGTDYGAIANALNATAAPDYWVYKPTLTRHEVLTGTGPDGTTFAWAGAGYITRSQGERDAFREMFNSTGTVNPALPSIQAAFADIFSGAGGASNRTHIQGMSRRKATRVEKAFATGAGTTGAPSALGFEGAVSISDIGDMFNV